MYYLHRIDTGMGDFQSPILIIIILHISFAVSSSAIAQQVFDCCFCMYHMTPSDQCFSCEQVAEPSLPAVPSLKVRVYLAHYKL